MIDSQLPVEQPPVTPRILRQFAVLWLFFFGALSWFGRGAGEDRPALVLATVAALGLIGLVVPGFMRPIFIGATVLTMPIGKVVSKVVLAALFYGVFTPLALAFRLLKRDVLVRSRPQDKESYWQPILESTDPSRYFRQS